MMLTTLIYSIDSEGIIRTRFHKQLNSVKSYVLSHKEQLLTLDKCVIIVNMETKQYYIYNFPGNNHITRELREEIDSTIRLFEDQLTRGEMALTVMYKGYVNKF